MTSVFAHGVQEMLKDVTETERTLELLQKFIDSGGSYRLAVVADHPDPEVKAAVERIATRNNPSSFLLKGFTKFAHDDVVRAREALRNFCKPFSPQAAPPQEQILRAAE